jgi:hypothetical protein
LATEQIKGNIFMSAATSHTHAPTASAAKVDGASTADQPSAASSTLDQVTTAAKDIAASARTAAKPAFDAAKGAAASARTAAQPAIDVAKDAVTSARDAAQPAVDVVKDVAASARNAAEPVVGKLRSTIRENPLASAAAAGVLGIALFKTLTGSGGETKKSPAKPRSAARKSSAKTSDA